VLSQGNAFQQSLPLILPHASVSSLNNVQIEIKLLRNICGRQRKSFHRVGISGMQQNKDQKQIKKSNVEKMEGKSLYY
jgi:glutamine amidotransferase PdxT